VWRITTYLGYSADLQSVRQIAKEVEQDGDNEISFPELLKIIRRVRDQETQEVIEVLSRHGTEPNSCPIEDLGMALLDLGYFVQEDVVFDILDEMGETKSEDSLDVNELLSFLRLYRKTEGFQRAEMQELQDVFDREARGDGGALRTLDVGRVLRWFGFSRTVQQVQNLVTWIDFDGSGELEFNEFLKLMRRMHQDEAKQRLEFFDALKNKITEEVSVSVVGEATLTLYGVQDYFFWEQSLKRIAAKVPFIARADADLAPYTEAVKNAELLDFLDRNQFEAFFRHYRNQVVTQIHANAGFAPAEVERLRRSFAGYDKDGGGTLERAELVKMLGEHFPDATTSKEGQRQISEALSEVDKDGSGSLNFGEFLLLMRKCDDRRDAADLRLEMEVVKDCGMVAEEVEGFRQIFLENIDWKGELTLETLIVLLATFVDMTPEDLDELAAVVRDVHPQSREVARFPQFLQLIRRLTQDNFLRVNDMATRAVRQQQKRQQRGG